jgi:HSP20 family protein
MIGKLEHLDRHMPFGFNSEGPYITPPIDIYETETSVIVLADIPGVDQEKLDLDLKGDVLSIIGRIADDDQDGKFLVTEFVTGSYYRQILLGSRIDKRNINATLKDGVLKIVLPKISLIGPRRINIGI